MHGKLREFVKCHLSGQKDPNLTSMVIVGSSSAGQKPGSQRTKRKRTRVKKASDSSFVKKVDRIELFLLQYDITTFFILDTTHQAHCFPQQTTVLI